MITRGTAKMINMIRMIQMVRMLRQGRGHGQEGPGAGEWREGGGRESQDLCSDKFKTT